MENQRLEHRSIIKFLDLEGQSPSNIHERMTAVYGDSAPFSTIKKLSQGKTLRRSKCTRFINISVSKWCI